MMLPLPTKYDEVLYPGFPMQQTHPDRLATLATLFGIKPALPELCRVLELGCGDGGNLIPMAFSLPDSRFIGIDLSARAIAKGQELQAELGLKNVTLRQLDIMDVTPEFGEFDYIIAHGIYSWVPAAARDKILSICRANLAPQGIAYVSYNAYPGGHLRAMMREMMLFHTRNLTNPSEKVQQARALVKFLSDAHPNSDFYGLFYKNEVERVVQNREALLYHDDLEETNTPVYFWQFVDHAAQHGLRYVAEADFHEMHDQSFPPGTSQALRYLSNDQIVKEQYLDFLKNRKFRQTLLCHEEVQIDRTLTPERMTIYAASSSLLPVSAKPDIYSRVAELFRTAKGTSLETDHPLAKAAILRLGEVWPRAVRFNELLAMAQAQLETASKREESERVDDALVLGETLLKTYAANAVQLHLHVPKFVLNVNERPVASPLARLQAKNGNVLTSLRHTPIKMEDPVGRRLVELMDGTRDRASLIEELSSLITSGALVMRRDGQPVSDAGEAIKFMRDHFEESLTRMARLALLVA